MNQAKFMREFSDKYREDFNPDLFERDNYEIVNSIRSVVESCQRDKYYTLKLLSFDVIENYREIYDTLRHHQESRKKKNSKIENQYDYINIRDTDILIVRLLWLLRHNGLERQEINGETKEVINPQETMEVLIALPRFVRKYYFRLSGNYYTTTFQIVDGSTYNNSTASQSKVDSIVLKTTFMPVRIFRSFNKNMVELSSGEYLKPIEYQSIIFNNVVNVIYYILAAYGMYGTMQFLEIDCVYILSEPIMLDDYYSFEKNDIYISCPKVAYQDPMIQSFIATVYDGINKDATVNTIFDQRYWLRNLGAAFKNNTVDKGLFVLDSIDGIYDNITKEYLHLPMRDKENIYCVLRWLIREFSNLRVKDNVDVRTKRIRIADYIAAVYAEKLNKGIHRISDMGTRVTLKKVKQAIYTDPMYVIKSISTMSNLVSYRDLMNDADAMTALKYTYKGISGLGEDNASVQPVYRYVDPSHVGILDLDASSASDPGMSGMLCPMTKIYGKDKSFSEYEEPNNWRENFAPIRAEYKKDVNQLVTFDYEENINETYAKNRQRIVDEELEINKIWCPIVDLYDPNKLYTCSGVNLNQLKEEPEKKSLFTIRDSISEEDLIYGK